MKATIPREGSGADLTVDYLPVYTYAALLARLAPVSCRPPEGAPPARRLEFRIPEIDYSGPVPGSPAGEAAAGNAVANRLEGLARRTESHVCLEDRGREVARLPVALLPPAAWSHSPESRVLAAAHVVAGDDAVFRTVVDSSARRGSLREVVRCGRDRAALTVLREIYDHVATNRIEYEEPDTEQDSWCGASYQNIRMPHDVTGAGDGHPGKGTCLDLTLFLAGALESTGIPPLIVFTGSREESPAHAFLGCWADGASRYRPLLTGDALREKLGTGELLVLESTGLCSGSHHRTFDEAAAAARDLTSRGERLHAVDVRACRPPHGTVRAVTPANDPGVEAAYWAGEELRRRLCARARETLHILYGLCEAPGGMTRRLFHACGGSADRVRQILEANLQREDHTGPCGETHSYRVCLETARLNARNRGSAVVAEADVLWAVLDSPSRNVRKVVEAAGTDCSTLVAWLNRERKRPREATISRHFDSEPVSGD